MCEEACPFGNIFFSEQEQKTVKCELCNGNPQCVLFCATKALEFREPEAKTAGKRRALAEKLKEVYQLQAV
jgi:Fe-S-cluster-containing hydrogenase component 2